MAAASLHVLAARAYPAEGRREAASSCSSSERARGIRGTAALPCATVPDATEETPSRRWSRRALAALVLGAGTMHFAAPGFFDELVPAWVPGDARAWTYASGAAELAVGGLLANRRTEHLGGWAALALFVAVSPANVQDAFDHPPTDGRGIASLLRLPLQLALFAWALHHARPPGRRHASRPVRTVRG